MKITCFECGIEFVPGELNTRIIGPDVEVNCPFCHYKYQGKLSSFVRDQIGDYRAQSPCDAARMIEIAEFMELNSSDYYKKRGLRHGRKKVRNVRD